MSSMEMGAYPFMADSDKDALIEADGDTEEKVATAYGNVKVTIYGDRKRHPVVTFHDLGLDAEHNFQNFFMFGTIAEFTDKFCVYNINAPGQEMDAQRFHYPTMDGLAKIVECVVENYELKNFICFGIGVGANVLMRYALNNASKVDAMILINCDPSPAGWIEWFYQKMNMRYLLSRGMTSFTVDYLMWHHFGRHLESGNGDIVQQYRTFFQHLPHPTNLAAFIDCYLNRTPLDVSRDGIMGKHLKVPVLQIVGAGSAFVNETVMLNTKLDPTRSDWMKVSDACGLVLDDRPEKVTEAMLLFLQGLGYFPSMNVSKLVRRMSNAQNGLVEDEGELVRQVNELQLNGSE